jgi:membrane protein YdbS with pleckstrin-like domain
MMMRFPARLLNEGETVVLDLRPHWWYLSGPTAAVVVTVAGAVTAAIEAVPLWVTWVALVALGAAAIWLLGRYARWASIRMVVTDVRVADRRGVLVRRVREIPLSALTNISYRQSLFKRLIGAGDIVLESAGRDSREVFPDVPKPALVHNVIYRQFEMWHNGAGPGPSPTTQSIPAQIDQLDQLRRRGVITEAEFNAKKTQLLDRL